MKRHAVLLVLLTAAALPAQSVISVPGQFATVQGAIAAASNGDFILVAPGVYPENVDFLGKAVTVKSAQGAAATILDGGLTGGSVVAFVNGEGHGSTLDGFTVTNGLGAGLLLGGGITILQASPNIVRCVITGNTGGPGGAGGIHITGGVPLIGLCTIAGNVGGDLTNKSTFSQGGAGGIQGGSFPGAPVAPFLFGCVIRDNQGGDGLTLAVGGAGGTGGIHLGGSPFVGGEVVLMLSCVVADNVGGNGQGGFFGGSGGTGGMALGGMTGRIIHTTFTNNMGGGFINSGSFGHGGLTVSAPTAPIRIANAIFWNDRDGAGTGDEIFPGGSTVEVRASDVQGGFPGAGNIDADPLFVDPVNDAFPLTAASPCRDAAACADLEPPLIDLDLESRAMGSAPDMGADEVTDNALEPTRLGSCEDLLLGSQVDGAGDPDVMTKSAGGGDVLSLTLDSPGGTFAGSLAVLAAEGFAVGSPPSPPSEYVEVHVSTGSLLAHVTVLPPGGAAVSGPVPGGLAGFAVRFQGFAFNGLAANGVFAATNAHDVVLQ